jgi:ABC-type transporter Mla subunit MlaD
MLVVGDLDDVFLPKPSDILVNLAEAKTAIESLLSRLSDMFKDTHNVGNALGAALQAAFKLVVSLAHLLKDHVTEQFQWSTASCWRQSYNTFCVPSEYGSCCAQES